MVEMSEGSPVESQHQAGGDHDDPRPGGGGRSVHLLQRLHVHSVHSVQVVAEAVQLQPRVRVVQVGGLLRALLPGAQLLQLLDARHVAGAALAAVVVDGLLAHEVLRAGDHGLAPEHRLGRQLSVLQRLVDGDVVAAVPGRDHHRVLDQLEGSPGELHLGRGVETLEAAADVDPLPLHLLLPELGGHGGAVDHHPGRGRDLALEAGHLAGVGPGHGGGGFVEQQPAVLGVVVRAGRQPVLQVHLVAEQLADQLRPRVAPARDPLAEGRGVGVEVPLDLELLGLGLVVVEVAVQQHVLAPLLHHARHTQLLDLHSPHPRQHHRHD